MLAPLSDATTPESFRAPAEHHGRRVVAPTGDPFSLERVRAANVRVFRPDTDATALDRAVVAWEQARRTSTPYLVHDADPLAWVAEAWAQRFQAEGSAGDIEVAVAETLARWRARSLNLPDYYLLTDPERLSPILRPWFLGLLGSAAPSRVVNGRAGALAVDQLADLRPGPWWPGLDRVLAGIERVLPEQLGGIGTPSGAAELVEP
jgi:hypothetical protein